MRNVYRLEGSLIFLTVGDGVEACVDAEDLPRISPYNWTAVVRRESKNGQRAYVQTRVAGKTVYLHRLILEAPAGLYIDHINHDTLDNRRANLRVVTHQENDMNRDGAYNTSRTGVRGVSTHVTNKGGRLHVFRCHGRDCKVAKYFPYTEHGLKQASAFAEAHYAGQDPPAWTLERERLPIKRTPTKLSDDDVRAIRVATGTQASVANTFGISGSLVSMIRSRKKRPEVPD